MRRSRRRPGSLLRPWRVWESNARTYSLISIRYNALFPSGLYKSYVAYESGSADNYNLRVVGKRKTSTFYYSPLDPAGFDAVINPAGVEPVVQFTLYLKVKYR